MVKPQQSPEVDKFKIEQPSPLAVLPHIGSRRVVRTVRRSQLREIVPLSDTTIYEMEQRGEFPRRFNLTPRCVVWDLAEVEAWVQARRNASTAGTIEIAPGPDVRSRKTRPVKSDRG
ncbi:helix-turn-helix transcriptional regulator [Mesorhizobium ventifaucium]|uniref:Phage transcriptional regulator, AlpA (Modular protein) n=1 Tax=Mesorhizobium ventifaucium TaxID=666020 RepID=A0ABN8K7L1_9HYPH|nr:Phage transcriptional regulator, AlpA (Modular protein) [Mesorhizobium ventifaucium]